MAKGSTGSRPWSVYASRGIAHLNARIGGVRHRPSLHIPYDPLRTSKGDLRRIEEAAAAEYAKLVAGRTLDAQPGARVLTTHTLDELGGLWIENEAKKLWPRGWKTRFYQLRNVIDWANNAPRFAKDKRTALERIADDAGPMEYATDRLAEILKETIDKEVSNLFKFFDWALRSRFLASSPKRPSLPRSAIGTRSGPQREAPVDVTYREAIDICNALPEWTVRGGRGIQPGKPLPPKAFRVRDRVRFAFEQALRPGDAGKLEVPRHWQPGQRFLRITPDIDKIGFEGDIALTKVALEILERCAPENGLIFGRHDISGQIKTAALAILPPEKAKRFAAYDFRHGRLTDAVEKTNDLLGASGLARHRQTTTINRYVRAQQRHVEKVVGTLDAADSVSTRSAEADRGSVSEASAEEVLPSNSDELVRRAGLEPARCYPLAPQEDTNESSGEVEPPSRSSQTPTNADSDATGEDARSAHGQQYLGRAQRKLAFETALWEAFDLLQLREGGIDLDPDDSPEGGR